MILPWLGFSILGVLNIILFNTVSIIALYSHLKTMTTNPGAVPKTARPLLTDKEERDYESGSGITVAPGGRTPPPTTRNKQLTNERPEPFKKYCRKCKAFKPIRAHHCSICRRCIVKMDHHCPWVNNCVGVGNHKLFLLFVFWVLVTCIYALAIVSGRYISCMYKDECGDVENHLLVIFLVIESILFGLFTMCMLGDQMSSISINQTQIDRLKGTKHEQQTEVNEVFGTPYTSFFRWNWLIPVAVSFGDKKLRDRILGFREDDDQEEFNPLMSSTGDRSATSEQEMVRVLIDKKVSYFLCFKADI